MKLSVIIPTLDERSQIDGCLAAVGALAGVHEIIVVDGCSADGTAELAGAHSGVRVVASRRGRGAQQNTGAAAATGDVLLFLHCDAKLPPRASALVGAALSDGAVVGGAFTTWHVPTGRWRGRRRAALLHLADLRSRYSPLPYGDQAIFVRRAAFERVGGFPDVPLMEDLALSRSLRAIGKLAILSEAVRVSGRRFESSALYQTLLVNVFPLLYHVGVPPRVLSRLYGDPR